MAFENEHTYRVTFLDNSATECVTANYFIPDGGGVPSARFFRGEEAVACVSNFRLISIIDSTEDDDA